MSNQDREQREGSLVFRRIVELELDPVRGNFDAAHLREINRRLFQDLPAAGFPDVRPGQYREPVPAGRDWYKNRGLSMAPNQTFFVAYSSMDGAAQARLDKALEAADREKLRGLNTKEFTAEIGKLYAELDYIHPFSDGNSRTLRTFTGQLAKEAGYDIDWERFNQSPAGRDTLYIARDLSVNELAEPHLQDHNTRVAIATSVSMLGGNRNLPDLLTDAVRPLRAAAFEKLPEGQAMREHPELVDAYKTLHAAAAYFKREMPADLDVQHQAIEATREKILMHLNSGETRGFSSREPQPAGRDRIEDPER